MISLIATLALGTAQAEDNPSSGKHVEIVESGPFKMKDKRDYKNLVVLGPMLFPPGVAGRYERALSNHFGVMVGAGYGVLNIDSGGNNTKLQTVVARAGFDYLPIGNGLHGFYVGPRLMFRNYSGKGDAGNGLGYTAYGGGALIGWRWIFNPGPSISVGLGGKYMDRTASASAEGLGDSSTSFSGSGALVEFNLGWAF